MIMDQMEQVRLEAFFDEFAELEKRAMLEKAASVTLGRGIAKGFKRLVSRPLKDVPGVLQRGYQRGIRKAEKAMRQSFAKDMPVPQKVELSTPQRVIAGLRGVWETPTGKALGATAAGGTALAGSAALAAGAGRRRHGQQQNVYVR
jgi:hypothetical protein